MDSSQAQFQQFANQKQAIGDNAYWRALGYSANIKAWAPAMTVGAPTQHSLRLPTDTEWTQLGQYTSLPDPGEATVNQEFGQAMGVLNGADIVMDAGNKSYVYSNTIGLSGTNNQANFALFPVVLHLGPSGIKSGDVSTAGTTQIRVCPYAVVVSTTPWSRGSAQVEPRYVPLPGLANVPTEDRTRGLEVPQDRNVYVDVSYMAYNRDSVLAIAASTLAFGTARWGPDLFITIGPYVHTSVMDTWVDEVSDAMQTRTSYQSAFAFEGASLGLAVAAAIMGLPPIMYTGYFSSFGRGAIFAKDGQVKPAVIGANLVEAVKDVDLKALLAYQHNVPFVIPLTAANATTDLTDGILRAESAARQYKRAGAYSDTRLSRVAQLKQPGGADLWSGLSMFKWYENTRNAIYTTQLRTFGLPYLYVGTPVMAAVSFTEVQVLACLCQATIQAAVGKNGRQTLTRDMKQEVYSRMPNFLATSKIEETAAKRVVKKTAAKRVGAVLAKVRPKKPKAKKVAGEKKAVKAKKPKAKKAAGAKKATPAASAAKAKKPRAKKAAPPPPPFDSGAAPAASSNGMPTRTQFVQAFAVPDTAASKGVSRTKTAKAVYVNARPSDDASASTRFTGGAKSAVVPGQLIGYGGITGTQRNKDISNVLRSQQRQNDMAILRAQGDDDNYQAQYLTSQQQQQRDIPAYQQQQSESALREQALAQLLHGRAIADFEAQKQREAQREIQYTGPTMMEQVAADRARNTAEVRAPNPMEELSEAAAINSYNNAKDSIQERMDADQAAADEYDRVLEEMLTKDEIEGRVATALRADGTGVLRLSGEVKKKILGSLLDTELYRSGAAVPTQREAARIRFAEMIANRPPRGQGPSMTRAAVADRRAAAAQTLYRQAAANGFR